MRVASGQGSCEGEGSEGKAGIAAGMGIVKVKPARWQQKAQKAPPSSPSSKLPQNLLLLFYINSKCAKIKQTKCRAGAWGKGGGGVGLGAWQAQVFMPLAIE